MVELELLSPVSTTGDKEQAAPSRTPDTNGTGSGSLLEPGACLHL